MQNFSQKHDKVVIIDEHIYQLKKVSAGYEVNIKSFKGWIKTSKNVLNRSVRNKVCLLATGY